MADEKHTPRRSPTVLLFVPRGGEKPVSRTREESQRPISKDPSGSGRRNAMQARKRTILLAVLSLLLLVAGSAQANPYAKYAGTTLVVNFPNIAYYNYATNVIPEFKIHESIHVVLARKNAAPSFLMLFNPTPQIIRHACIKDSMMCVGQNVNRILSLVHISLLGVIASRTLAKQSRFCQ